MIIVKLKGGLGNQMFQYAVARGISNTEKEVLLDTSFFSYNKKSTGILTARKYELSIFPNLKASETNSLYSYALGNGGLQRRVLRKMLFPSINYIIQKENELINFNNTPKNRVLLLDGFFQSEKYFKHIRKELINEFSFEYEKGENDKYIDLINSRTNSVSVHVRRGDYIKPAVNIYHGVLPLSYYDIAIRKIELEVEEPHYFIFSDDIEWCKIHFRKDQSKITFVERISMDDSWKDLYLMTLCRHHIVANSSYSWWGAWLSDKRGFKYAPSKWFNPDVATFDIHDFVPESWEIIYY